MKKRDIPNLLTCLRVVAIPFVVFSYYYAPGTLFPFLMFALISTTDFLDGYFARKWNVTSELGAFLDPAADKLLVVSLLLVLSIRENTLAFTVPAMLILLRELSMSMLREYLAKTGQSALGAVDKLGKYKTAAQMSAISCCLLPYSLLNEMGYLFLYLAAVLTIVSFLNYLVKLRKNVLILSSKYGLNDFQSQIQ